MSDVSWDDLIDSSSDVCYLNSTKLYECFSKAVRLAVDEVQADMTNTTVMIFELDTMVRLWFQFGDDELFKVNLFPSVRVNNGCENFQCIVKISSGLPAAFLNECCLDYGIHVVANSRAKSEESESQFWAITFNDIESRIVHSKAFECAKDCVTLLKKFNFPLYEGRTLSSYQFQALVLREILMKPKSKSWKKELLLKRMLGLLGSLKACLRAGRCGNVFTGVNLLSQINDDILEKMAEKVHEYHL